MPAVVKLLVPRYENGQPLLLPDGETPYRGAGTGWLIGKELLMTNYHVIRNRLRQEAAPSDDDLKLQAINTVAQFFYDNEEAKGTKIDIKDLIAVGKERTEDFALLRLAKSPDICRAKSSVLSFADGD